MTFIYRYSTKKLIQLQQNELERCYTYMDFITKEALKVTESYCVLTENYEGAKRAKELFNTYEKLSNENIQKRR